MLRIATVYGLVSGAIVIGVTVIGLSLLGGENLAAFPQWLGYLVMLLALTLIFVGVKRYRDQEQGGVITFGRATLVGLAIATVAGLVYVLVWEVYLAATDYAFIDQYAAATIEQRQAEGASEAELEALAGKMDTMRAAYANPLFRLPMTFLEIFPVGVLIALLSALLLRRSSFLPAA